MHNVNFNSLIKSVVPQETPTVAPNQQDSESTINSCFDKNEKQTPISDIDITIDDIQGAFEESPEISGDLLDKIKDFMDGQPKKELLPDKKYAIDGSDSEKPKAIPLPERHTLDELDAEKPKVTLLPDRHTLDESDAEKPKRIPLPLRIKPDGQPDIPEGKIELL